VSVLGQPQHEWDEFLKESHKPQRRWTPARILWIAVPVVVVAAVVVLHYVG
jgi:hypothetical protein